MTATPVPAPAPLPEEATYCQRHPSVESALRCGRCETLICPRCLVFTPAGTRCPDCARLRRLPMYELGATDYARAAGTAVGLGLALGIVGALIVPVGAFRGLLFLTLAVLGGSALGGLVAEALQRATRHKRGPTMQAAAATTLVLAGVTRLLLSGGLQLLTVDLAATILVVIAIVVAWGRLR